MTRNRLLRLAVAFSLFFGALFLFSALSVAQTEVVSIRIRDACDPKSFNEVIGPGTCIGGPHGTTKFKLFIEEIKEDHFAGAWRFNPLLKASTGTFQLVTLKLDSGRQTALQNKGGETHTFTRVEKFGGGLVPPLNQLSGNPEPAPECLQPPSDTNIFVEAGETDTGPTAGTSALPVGENKFQCCIHPWMRLRIVVH